MEILRGLAAVRAKLAELGVSEEEAAKRLTRQALLALLYSVLSSRAAEELVAPKAWFTVEDRELKPIARFEEFYDSGGGVGYITCSVCGSEPAVLRPSKIARPGATDYSVRARSMLEKLGFAEEEIDELKVWGETG